MARDVVVNVVTRLMDGGYDPRRVGDDAWESRCPVHRSLDHALAITRNELGHVVLECRSDHKCLHIQVVRALGVTNEHLYAETPDAWIRRLRMVPVQGAFVPAANAGASRTDEAGPSSGEPANDNALTAPADNLPVLGSAADRAICVDAGEVDGFSAGVVDHDNTAGSNDRKTELGHVENQFAPIIEVLLSPISGGLSADPGGRARCDRGGPARAAFRPA